MTFKNRARIGASSAALALAMSAVVSGAAFAQSPTISPQQGAPTTPGTPSAADQAPNDANGTASGAAAPRSVDEIVVTAQKRTQSLQDVPIVVTVVGAKLLQDTGVRDIRDLTILTPGLTVTSTSNESVVTARVRGVGTVGDNPGLESSVGVVIDGVYRPRNGVSFGDLGEMQRIEVLKGPQGTLFGKSTSSGVINVITQQPSFKFGANGELTVGDYGQLGGSASVTGPIIEDKLAGRLYVADRKRDGFLNVVTGAGPRTTNEDQNQDFYTIRGQLLYTPTPDLDFKFIGDYSKRSEDCCAAVQIAEGSAANSRANLINATRPGSIASGVLDPFARTAYSNRDTNEHIEDKGVSLEMNYKTPFLNGAKFTNILAYREWSIVNGQDSDFSAADIAYRPLDGRNGVGFKTFTEEARLSGEYGRLNWLVGAFYANEKLDRKDSFLYGADYYSYFAGKVLGGAPSLIGLGAGTVFQPGAGINDRYRQNDDTLAFFTNDTLKLTDSWDVTVGYRFTRDTKDFAANFNTTGSSCRQATAAYGALARAAGAATAGAVTGGLCLTWENPAFDALNTLTQRKEEEESSGTIKTSYRFNRQILAYASYSRGYKAGGFNLDRTERTVITATGPTFVPITDTSFAPETVDAYEGGVKTTLFNRSLILNAALFHQTYNNFQLNIFLGTTFTVKSMPEVVSRGIDTDFVWFTPLQGLSFQGGLTYAETQFSKTRPNDPDFCLPGQAGGVCGAGTVLGGALQRLPGSRLSFAPLYSLSIAGTYEKEIVGDLMGRLNVGMKYQSDYNTGSDLQPLKAQTGFPLLNARIGIGPRDQRWAVEFFVQNLLDQDYIQVAFNGPLQGTETDPLNIRTYDAFLGQPRTVGATFRVKY